MAPTDVLLVSLGSTAGLRAADAELAASLTRAGARVAVARAAPPRELRTFALVDLGLGPRGPARRGAGAARDAVRGRSSTRPPPRRCCGPSPGASASTPRRPPTGPGRHGVWQRPVERRRLGAAPLLVPWSEGGLGRRRRHRAKRSSCRCRWSRRGARGRPRHRGDHLRGQPGQEGPGPRPGGLGARAPTRRGAGGRRAPPGRWRRGRARRRTARAAGLPGAPAPRAGVRRPRRGARTTGSPSWRRSPTAACSSAPRRPAPTRRCRRPRGRPAAGRRGPRGRPARCAGRPGRRLRRARPGRPGALPAAAVDAVVAERARCRALAGVDGPVQRGRTMTGRALRSPLAAAVLALLAPDRLRG